MKKYIPFLLLFALLDFGCRSVEEPEETATIIGVARLAEGWSLTPPFSGIHVSLEGTKFTTTTDDSGSYSFKEVPQGTYTVRFEKAGYGTIKWIGKTVEGGGNSPIYWVDPYGSSIYYSPSLYKIPTTEAPLATAYFKDTTFFGTTQTHLILRGTMTPNGNQGVIVYAGTSDSVSPEPGHYRMSVAWEERTPWDYMDTVNGHYTLGISLSYLRDHNFKSGDSIYLNTYAIDWHAGMTQGDYFDPVYGVDVWTSVGPATTKPIGLVVP